MPFAAKKKDEVLGGQGQNVSGVSTSFNVPGQQGQQGQTQKASGQYQNIEKYLSANAPQAQAMGEKVAQNVEGQIGAASKATSGLAGGVQKVEAYDPSKVLTNVGAADKNQYNAIKETGGYTGAKDISGLGGYGEAKKTQGTAIEKIGQVGSDTGQKELLKEAYARPAYSSGAQNLDQSLLQRSTGGRQAIESLSNKYKDLSSQFSSQEQAAADAIKAAQGVATTNKAAFAPAEEAAKKGILSPIEQRVEAAKKQNEAFKGLANELGGTNLSTAARSALGLKPGQRIFDLNLADYINPQTQEANVQNIASADERKRYNDLLNFLGTNTNELAMSEPTYKAGAFDKDRLASDVYKKEAEYDNAFNTTDMRSIDPQLSFLKNNTPAGYQHFLDSTGGDKSYGMNKIVSDALDAFNSKYGISRAVSGSAGKAKGFSKGKGLKV